MYNIGDKMVSFKDIINRFDEKTEITVRVVDGSSYRGFIVGHLEDAMELDCLMHGVKSNFIIPFDKIASLSKEVKENATFLLCK